MKNLARRWIAGVSAAMLLVSAVGVDAFTNRFMGTASADASRGKNGRSTGFENLERDTTIDNEYYNTGYGLHTNKTASVADGYDDGRTFDVNLESWYVGENPVDVATILDASGSMAWTMDTLDYMWVSDYLTDEEVNTLKAEYNITDVAVGKDENYDSEEKIALLSEIQSKSPDNYLPQDVVDMILDPKNTDNSKLGYDKYMYYVYEARSSVSEFVPLGYWDGGIDPMADPSLIGYYPFSGDLKNKAPNAKKDATAIMIHHPSGDGVYDPDTPV